MLDTDQLRSFVAIVDTGSFTRAAERVNKTQSAVSMHIRRLEEQLGRPLFAKQGRGVRLSDDGEKLIDYARQMLQIEAAAFASRRRARRWPAASASASRTTMPRASCREILTRFISPASAGRSCRSSARALRCLAERVSGPRARHGGRHRAART